jgi:DNA-directed RNA polymerase subunit RPC12/RpoP
LQQSFPCPKCGAQIPVGQYLCSTCGQRFEYRCRHCGNAIGTSSGFCTNCGGKLYHLAQHTHYKHAARVEHTVQQPVSQIGRYLIVVAIIFFLVGIIYAVGTSSQGDSSNWLGGYNFGGQSPPSTPPATDGTAGQQKPKPVSDSPAYTIDQVIAAAKQLSPDCRLQTRRTG